jgi:hypothetical protein
LALIRVLQLNVFQAWHFRLQTKVVGDFLAQPSRVDQLMHLASAGQGFHGPLHERFALDLHQRLGAAVAQWAHALTSAGS